MDTFAGFWKRAAALVIDGIILTLVQVPVLFIIGMIFGVGVVSMIGGGMDPDNPAVGGLSALFQLAVQGLSITITWLYFAFMESSASQGTLGKMAMGIKVTDASGDRITFLRATGRFFSKMLSQMVCCIGYIIAAFTDKKQALHDFIASTLVVNK